MYQDKKCYKTEWNP